METINIVFSSDNNYAQFMGVTLCSIFENKKNDYLIDIYVLDGGIQEDNKIRIREIQKLASSQRIGTHVREDVKINTMITKFGISRVIEIYTKEGILFDTCNFSPEASTITGVKRSSISNNLVGISKSAGEYIFKYKNIA